MTNPWTGRYSWFIAWLCNISAGEISGEHMTATNTRINGWNGNRWTVGITPQRSREYAAFTRVDGLPQLLGQRLGERSLFQHRARLDTMRTGSLRCGDSGPFESLIVDDTLAPTPSSKHAAGSDCAGAPARATAASTSVVMVGSYVPRQCGIATFTRDVAQSLISTGHGVHVSIVAVNDKPATYDYPDEVEFEIERDCLDDYKIVADHLNANNVDVVCIQHEFGIYGGSDGTHVLELLRRLRMPKVATLHTILAKPSAGQRQVIVELAELCDRLVVLSETGARFLSEIYGVPKDRVVVIPHGIPDLPFVDPNYYKHKFAVDDDQVILTFGLLSPSKGIEYMIRAMPTVLEKHPRAIYFVVGATHPHVRECAGESYRRSLEKLCSELGVGERVRFIDRFVEVEELCEYLGVADVYVVPYRNLDQIVSGTLAYAMGAGKAVISTPYYHATEMLAGERGTLVPFDQPLRFARAINDLLANEPKRHAIRRRAYDHCRENVWERVGARYLHAFEQSRTARYDRLRSQMTRPTPRVPLRRVELNLAHLERMTDDTGLFQHATYFVPNREHGYCTDDVARALIVVVRARASMADPRRVDELTLQFLSFLMDAFLSDLGGFRNFLSYDRRWSIVPACSDSHGRALWALGTTAATVTDERLAALASSMFHQALPAAYRFDHLRSIACSLLGVANYLDRYPGDSTAKRARQVLAVRLDESFRGASQPTWPWPENTLTYANARLPQALIVAGHQMGNSAMTHRGVRALEWLVALQTVDGRFSPIGNQGWYPRDGVRARFDQQPIEADCTIAACLAAYTATSERRWLGHASVAYGWYLGQNDIGHVLVDWSTGGCKDGFGTNGVNENQGAESTLAWLGASLQMQQVETIQSTLTERSKSAAKPTIQARASSIARAIN